MKSSYGYEGPAVEVELDGVVVVLSQQAYISSVSGFYEASAILASEIGKEDAEALYTVYWRIVNAETEDESDACSWDNPVAIRGPTGWVAGAELY